MQKKTLLLIFWLLILLVGPVTLLGNITSDTFREPVLLINFFQRLTGLLAFSLLFNQIIFGSFMGKILGIVGSKAYRVHVVEGLLAYGLILIHPMLYTLFTYETVGIFNPLLTILPFVSTSYEIYLTYGRIALALLTIGLFAAYFRTRPTFRKHWLKLHFLNYFAFIFVAIHVWNVGTDVRSVPFVWFFWAALIIIAFRVFYRLTSFWRLRWGQTVLGRKHHSELE